MKHEEGEKHFDGIFSRSVFKGKKEKAYAERGRSGEKRRKLRGKKHDGHGLLGRGGRRSIRGERKTPLPTFQESKEAPEKRRDRKRRQ